MIAKLVRTGARWITDFGVRLFAGHFAARALLRYVPHVEEPSRLEDAPVSPTASLSPSSTDTDAEVRDAATPKHITTDRDGRPLDGSGYYRIMGPLDMPAAWWSVTLYDRDHELISNLEERFAFTSFNVIPEDDGTFVIDVASERPAGAMNWLPCKHGEPFSVVVRLYRSGTQILDGKGMANPLRICKVHTGERTGTAYMRNLSG